MPAHWATQALLYVLLLQPQTGSYCMVQTQSALGASAHLLVLQAKLKKQMPDAHSAKRMFFIGRERFEL